MLYLNFTKPVLDIILFSQRLANELGWQGPTLSASWYLVAAIIIKFISPSFGKMVAIEQKLEGEYRAKHNALLNHSEEVAFYNGSKWEKTQIDEKYDELEAHYMYVMIRRFWMGIFDSMLVKYGAVMVGYSVLGLPVFGPNSVAYLKKVGNDETQITKDYIRNSSLLINQAKAIGRVVIMYKDLQALAGYTTLIYELDEVLEDLNKGLFKRI
jgi:ATP-binding cassette subfamily D (ALD) protein 3